MKDICAEPYSYRVTFRDTVVPGESVYYCSAGSRQQAVSKAMDWYCGDMALPAGTTVQCDEQ
jgi:hypothetical protein